MKGYVNDDETTASTIDADGWLHTGDIATIDENGVVSIVDRARELIERDGHQVAPAELEAVLWTHPEITDAAVVGSREADGDEMPKAFVVRSPGARTCPHRP